MPGLSGTATGLRQQLPELRQGIGPERRRPATDHRKPERTVQHGKLIGAEPPSLTLAKPQADHALASGDFVLQRDRVTAEPDHGGEGIKAAAPWLRPHPI